jgi:hypothetical protein
MNKKPKIVSNFDEHAHLGISIVSCRLFDLMAQNPKEYHKYTGPIYTILDGMYGYLSVNGHKVFFFWYNNSSENVCCDDVSEKFRVEYVSENGN